MDGSGIGARVDENITETIADEIGGVTANRTREPCGYIVAEGEGGVRFCDAPALRGSSYCAPHRALCQVAPDTPEGRALAATLAEEAARAPLTALGCALLELDESEPADALAGLDLPPRGAPEDAA